MGAVDNINHLRQAYTIRRGRQPKWTKKFIEFIIDICHVNAYVVWRRHQAGMYKDHREREHFMKELIEGLVEWQEDVHTKSQRQKSTYCSWSGCQPNRHQPRQPLQEVVNSARPLRARRTHGYCEKCMKTLCTDRGCWEAYHTAHGCLVEV